MGATSITAARMAGASAAKAATAEAAAQELQGRPPKEFVAKAVSKAAGRAATAAALWRDSFEGSSAGQQTGDQVRSMGLDVLQKNSPMFRDLVEGGATPEQAREEVARATENESALSAGAVAMSHGQPAATCLARWLRRSNLAGWGTSRTGGAIAGGIGEGPAEAVQGGAGQYARRTLPSRSTPTRHKTRWQALLTHRRVKASAGTGGMGSGGHPEARGAKTRTRRKLAALQRSQRRRSAGRSCLPPPWKVQKCTGSRPDGRGRSDQTTP